MATVKIYLPHLSGYITGGNTLTLVLTETSDASAVNGAGDLLAESGTSGWFSATVDEAWTETLGAAVVDQDGLVPAFGRLAVGSDVVSDGAATLDPADQSLIIDATTTILGRLPAALEGGRMAAALSAATQTQIAEILIDTGTTLPTQIAGIGGGDALLSNQLSILEALEVIQLKTDLLNDAPSGSVLLVSSGAYYCTRTDVELVFGIKNVIAWADLDNEADTGFIENRITTMIALAHEQTNDALRAGAYTIPVVAPVPVSLAYHVAALAGVLLYESRGAMDADSDDGTHRLTPFRKRWDTYIRNVLGQKVVLSAGRAITNNAPSVS